MPRELMFCTNVEQALGMIGIGLEVGVKEFAAGGTGASALGFDGHKDGIDFSQDARVLEFQHPAVLFLVVDVENAQAPGWNSGPARGLPKTWKEAFRLAAARSPRSKAQKISDLSSV